ncbi:sorbitol dehydrogenase [Yamadazyma tenuis]|uniref:GroES-like protein n=1 Tax=Candida tenuis (strain ATCC 10573 / BCRC 21748 / CBS 615 / JCM 9827 / NBRC 10315 / NRRL Y-1498 / VKM Y-70) TaxID=590646 RepID=G3B3T5_CANTC|nr:uncharacterized protein CANTEDRAFT_121312 [Yamadazyma tenuis ATCC 10573]EGV63728.1 hypothetical protein CANTEDRAFT_121312 [Yamadazyma tenuis ATCC 10573]WEJ96661.1 sorbitol dehydrogenase [Yamadazyma tenuis]
MAPIHEGKSKWDDVPNPCLMVGPGYTLKTGEAPIHPLKPTEVRLQVKCTGICGSDIHLWKKGGIGDLVITEDLIIGHEASGQILEIGSQVSNTTLKVGDRVAIEPQVPCGSCYLCMNGNYNLCESVDFLGMPPTNGSIQRFLNLDSKFVHKLPEGVSYEEGALAEVVSVGYHGIEKAGGLPLGKPAMVAGCGPIGLATLLLADISGAYPIVATDVNAERLEFAKKLVPGVFTYQINPSLTTKENAAAIRKIFGETEYQMPSTVLECTGVASSINTCGYTVRRNGKLVIVGVSSSNEIDAFPFMPLSFGEVDVKFVNRYHDSWPPVLNLIQSGKLKKINEFITHKVKLEDAAQAPAIVFDPKTPSMKVFVVDEMELN